MVKLFGPMKTRETRRDGSADTFSAHFQNKQSCIRTAKADKEGRKEGVARIMIGYSQIAS